jgi:hypothetical protein
VSSQHLAELTAEIEHMVPAVAGLFSPRSKAKLETPEAERSAPVSDCAATDTPPVDVEPDPRNSY